MDTLLPVTTTWGVEFEWPEEVVSLLEVVPYSKDFMNEIFDADDVAFAWRNKIVRNYYTKFNLYFTCTKPVYDLYVTVY